MDAMARQSLFSGLATIACWTIAGGFLGVMVNAFVHSADSLPAPMMCGNSVLEMGIGYGISVGFFGGCIVAATRRQAL